MTKINFINYKGTLLQPHEHFELTPPSFAPLLYQTTEEGIRVTSDVSLILHTKDLINRLGLDEARKILDSFSASSGSLLDKFKKNISDDELMKYVKPRYLQTPSELRSWFNYLNNIQADVIASINNENDDNQEVTPDATPDPTPDAPNVTS